MDGQLDMGRLIKQSKDGNCTDIATSVVSIVFSCVCGWIYMQKSFLRVSHQQGQQQWIKYSM